MAAADKAGLQVYLHAIGDRGVRMALDAHESARKANGRTDRRGRIEHIETISPADYPRFRALGVIASMQPLHANPDQNNAMVWAKNAGPDRASRGFSWGNIERAGARLVFGSDWPVVTSDVRRGLYCAVTRKTREGAAQGRLAARAGGEPRERAPPLHRRRRLRLVRGGRTRARSRSGKLRRPGGALGTDWFKSPPEAILADEVLLTLLDGRVVHRDPSFAAGLDGAARQARLGISSRPTTSVTSVSPASSQVSWRACAGSMSGAGLKKSAQAIAMNSQQTMAAVHATPGPPGIR